MQSAKFNRLRTASIASALLGSTMLSGTALAQEAQEESVDSEIIITAQKREQSLQDVPIAVTALGTAKLGQLQVQDFDDYARYLPSLAFQTTGPGAAQVYFRGVASGENANHSTSLPSVGTYLDEQPITTIQGALDIHVYDVARVEALAGPQGTLYGASSQAGTVKIVTNRPDTSGFYGAVDAEVNTVAHGEEGYVLEGFINAPLSDNAALRVVGWYDRDAGYIDNIPGTLTFPSAAVLNPAVATLDNAKFVEDDYNDVETFGARAALQVDLNENWTILPTLMVQKQKSSGFFGQESGLGQLQVQQFNPERSNDRWWQAALTVEGKIGNWDLTYAGAYLRRKIDGISDYSDYAYFYDALFGSGAYFYDNNGDLVNPNQFFESRDRFTKQSHELRILSPSDQPLRLIAGVFYQRQTHNIQQDYIVEGIADAITVPGTDSNIWLTKQLRTDRDYAAFGEVTYDITDKLSLTGGLRIYRYKNSLEGFFGFSDGFSSRTGVAACFGPPIVKGSPCTNVDKTTSDTDFIHKLNLTYKINDDALVYATWSRGFRPGGVNRRGTLPPYQPDELDNYEFGWKTTFADGLFRWNGAVYYLEWKDMQLSFLGANGLTEVRNAGNARVYGIESDFVIRPAQGLTFTLGGSYNDAKSTTDFCLFANPQTDCSLPGPDNDEDGAGDPNELLAPSGTRLPVSAKFKGNALARYEFPVGDDLTAHLQGSVVYEGSRTSDLRLFERALIGGLPDYTTVDFSLGVKSDRWSVEVYARNLFDSLGQTTRTTQCAETTCGDPDGVTALGGKIYTFVTTPRTIGLRVGTKF